MIVIAISSIASENINDNLDIKYHLHLESSKLDHKSNNIKNAHHDEQCNIHHCHAHQILITHDLLDSSDFKSIFLIFEKSDIYTPPLYSFFRPPISI